MLDRFPSSFSIEMSNSKRYHFRIIALHALELCEENIHSPFVVTS